MHTILLQKGYKDAVLIGEGGFSQVYRVRQGGTGKYYACKVSEHKEMLLKEAKLLEEIEHPLFPRYYTSWQDESRGYLVMEYISGTDLEQLVQRRGAFSERQAVRIALELAEGLKYLQERPVPVFYGDLKPHNIRIREDGRVKLIDLGCSYSMGERKRDRAGTYGFSAPEQLRDGTIGFSSDVYAFGRVLRYMLNGHCGEGASAGNLSVSRFIEKCTRERKEERYSNMRICMYEMMNCRKRAVWKKYPETCKNTYIFTRKNARKYTCKYDKIIWKKSYEI